MLKNISLRLSLAIGIIVMGFLGIVLALYVGETFRQVALDNQRMAYEDIINLSVSDLLQQLTKNSRSLGQSVQSNSGFRRDLQKRNSAAVEKYLNQHFHQYFVTAGILKLNSLIALDSRLEFVSKAVDEDARTARVGGTSCARLHAAARKRKGAARLKTISEVCLQGGYPFVHVLIPIGGLRVTGYLEVVTDPTYSMIPMEESLGMPIKVTLMDDRVVYKSSHWDSGKDNPYITASFTQLAGSAREAFRVTILRDITSYQKHLDDNLFALIMTAFMITFVLAAIMLLLVKRTTLDPLRVLGLRVGEISKDSSLLGGQIEIQGNKEVQALAIGINGMTSELKSLYDELQHTNSDLKEQVEERERIETELKQGRDHLEELVEKRTSDLAVARDTALDASRSKSQFLANMSHELRTPLNAIIGYTEILYEDAKEANNTDLATDLRKVYSAGEHLLRLIRDILDLSKIEAGKMELSLEDFSIESLVSEVVGTVRHVVEKNHNQLVVDCSDNSGSMYADSTKLRQTLLNLLSNAGKFTQNGTVTLKVRRVKDDREKIQFAITDTGIGLTTDEKHRVFQAFTQADTSTTRKYGGTGLGLAISRNFCLMMGGELVVSSEKGSGSTFTVILPAEVKEIPDKDSSRSLHAIPNPSRVRINRPVDSVAERRKHVSTILIIDDDPSVCELVSRYLVNKGYKTVSAQKGEEGMEIAREVAPDVILLDVLMSGMDGWEVLTALKQEETLRQIPVVMMSIIDDKNMGYALGAFDYLVKPVNKDRLYKIVNKCVRRRNQGPVLVIRNDDAVRTYINESLTDEGWHVINASNNFIAMDLAKSEIPSMILMDPSTKNFNVDEFVTVLCRQENTSNIPIVITTHLAGDARWKTIKSSVTQVITTEAGEVTQLMEKVFSAIHTHVGKKKEGVA